MYISSSLMLKQTQQLKDEREKENAQNFIKEPIQVLTISPNERLPRSQATNKK